MLYVQLNLSQLGKEVGIRRLVVLGLQNQGVMNQGEA
jgi:hypothetical protein